MRRRICQWCGVRLSGYRRWLRFQHCRRCALALAYSPSPPCRRWSDTQPDDLDLVPQAPVV